MEFLYSQQIKFKSQLEQQRLQLQREHSGEMEQILEKVSQDLKLLLSLLPSGATIDFYDS